MSGKKNHTIWPDDIAEGKGRGWTPVPRLLMRHWHRWGLDPTCFAVVCWCARWVNKSIPNHLGGTQVSASGIAKELGIGNRAVCKSLWKLHHAGLLRLTPLGRGRPFRVDLRPLVEKMRYAETNPPLEETDRLMEKSLTLVGAHICRCERAECRGCGRPEVRPLEGGFGQPEYSDLGQDHPDDRDDCLGEGLAVDCDEVA